MKRYLIQLLTVTAVLTTALSCGHDQQSMRKETAESDKNALFKRLVTETWEAKDEHLLPVTDSLESAGELSPAKADFIRGVTYDRARHIKVGEQYYAKLYETVDPEKEGWDFYLEVATRLSQIRMTMSDYKGSIDVATEILDRAEKAGKLNDGAKASYLWSIAVCQTGLGLKEAEQTRQEVYELLEKRAKEHGNGASINLLVFTYIIAETKMVQGDYVEAEKWLEKDEDMLKKFTQPGDSAIVREYNSLLAMARVHLLEGQNKGEQAYAFFRKSLPIVVISPECVSQAAEYLLSKGKYDEAADLYDRIDKSTPTDNKESEMNLENIGVNIIPRLQANLGAGRKDSAIAIAQRLAENYNQALNKDREDNAAELAIIYNTQGKEMEIAHQKAELSQQRLWGMGIALGLLLVFFIVYTEYRRRAANRLEAAHVKLQNAYDQLEETTAAKERIESELRIARDIQMSMVPDVFPEYKNLDMYAEMTPAKEVGGDLYGYVIQGDNLYFCVGDVSGKGVPASLFMAQSARLFRTLAAEGMMPADIAYRMNKALSENNDHGMFVTMFIGLLHLDTGCLDFCNCGHNPPILDGQFLKVAYDNQPLGLWEDDPFEGETIANIRGHQLLIYTDGLNEAENAANKLLGNKRLLELMSDTQSLNSHQVIDMLKSAVEEHRNGAEPNDDLTLMCITLNV